MFTMKSSICHIATTALLLSLLVSQQVAAAVADTSKMGDQWVSLSPRTSFLPASTFDNTEQHLRRLTSNNNNGYANILADGSYAKYDSYSQAWRLLGLYVDCESQVENQQRQRRRLEDEKQDEGEEEEENEGEADEEENGEEEEVEEDDDAYANEYNMNRQCTRYMLWAAYVDVDYQGGGIGEYQYYNPETKKWDRSACQASASKRCARMDCHLPNSHFKLLGFFKEANPVDFMGNLFSMQGSCQWSGDEYDFMTNQLAGLPEGCTAVSNNNNLYMDLKPRQGGTLDIGVYTDENCAIEYRGSKSTAEILEEYYANNNNNNNNGEDENNDGDEISVTGNMSQFNQALKEFQYCQPCRTFDLSNQGGYNNNNNSNNNGGRRLEEGEDEQDAEQEDNEQDQQEEEEQQENQGDNDEEGEQDNQNQNNDNAFICQDYNGDQGVNQCAFFAQQGDMSKASLRDVAIASAQGGLTRTYVAVDVQERSWWARFGFLTMSLLVFLVGLLLFCVLVKKKSRRVLSNKTEPLIKK